MNGLLVFSGAIVVVGTLLSPAPAREADYRLYSEMSVQRKIVGPLVGHVTDTTASIWAYAGPRTTPMVLELAAVSSQNNEVDITTQGQRLEVVPDPQRHHAIQFQIGKLQPATSYVFTVRLADDPAAVEAGKFTTAPAGKSTFRLAISSCFGGQYRRQDGRTTERRGYRSDSWKLLVAERPDLQLIIGDIVYADSTDYNHLWDSHTLERVNNRPFVEAIRSMPTYAVWDDHDYGPNNSDGTEQNKAQSLKAFMEVFANPSYGTDDTPGIFTRFSWGGVDFFLLDGRYHRSPDVAPDDPQKRMLGDGQFQWLVEQLKSSDAPFKLLVCGSTWQASRDDGWRVYRFARERLWQAIVENRISGVVFVSGDVHRSDVILHPPEVLGGYLFPEIISSGLGSHGKHDPMSFAIVDFDMTAAEPTMTARIIDGTGAEVLTRLVRASDLQTREP
ncbi:MAG: alkaline phosphatase D family protein [Pirellulales bacterium]